MLTRSQLKDIFARYGFSPLKRLGENYLIDSNIKDKIIAAAGVGRDDTVLEIGPGLGGLTFDLARTGADVLAIEKDRKACRILKVLARDEFPNLKIFNEDILKFNLGGYAFIKKIKVVGNLPYYITSPIIELVINNRSVIESAVVMVQREVAWRILAKPGSKDYSAFSLFVQFYTQPENIYTVKRTCFYPSPDVDSCIVRLNILDKPPVDVTDEALLFRIIRGSFNQRRKSIINSLSREAVLGISKKKLASILGKAGIDPAARPEDLSITDFAKIADTVKGVRPYNK